MSLLRRHPLLLLLGIGIAVRVVLAFTLVGPRGDVRAFELVTFFLQHDAANAYGANDVWKLSPEFPAWPYPPAYFAWLAVVGRFADATGLPFHGLHQLAPIAADAVIAIAVHVYLGWRGASGRARLAGAALVMLGPSFVAVSGYHGQIDSVAILPGVLALLAWERRSPRAKAAESGLLIGLGAAIKMIPGLLVLAVLPAARTALDRLVLVAAAVAVPVLMVLPFAILDPGMVEWLWRYQGSAGRGGLTLVLEPALGWDWVVHRELPEPSGIGGLVADNARWMSLAGVAALTAFLLRHRPAPVDAAVLLWLTVYVLSPGWFMQYLIWGLPFFIMAGYLKQTALLQLAILPATAIFYVTAERQDGLDPLLGGVYVASMAALWLGWVAALAILLARTAAGKADRSAALGAPAR